MDANTKGTRGRALGTEDPHSPAFGMDTLEARRAEIRKAQVLAGDMLTREEMRAMWD